MKIDETRIYTRLVDAIGQAPRPASKVFIGESEWNDLHKFLAFYGVVWLGGADGYYPNEDESKRAEFHGCKIYRVDARNFLAAL